MNDVKDVSETSVDKKGDKGLRERAGRDVLLVCLPLSEKREWGAIAKRMADSSAILFIHA